MNRVDQYIQELDSKCIPSLQLKKITLKEFSLQLLNNYKEKNQLELIYIEIKSFLLSKNNYLIDNENENQIEKEKEFSLIQTNLYELFYTIIKIIRKKRELINEEGDQKFLMNIFDEYEEEEKEVNIKKEFEIEKKLCIEYKFSIIQLLEDIYSQSPSNFSLSTQNSISSPISSASLTSNSSISSDSFSNWDVLKESLPSVHPTSNPASLPANSSVHTPTQLLFNYFSYYITNVISREEKVILSQIYDNYIINNNSFDLTKMEEIKLYNKIAINLKNKSLSFNQINYLSSFIPLFDSSFADQFSNSSSKINLLKESNRCFFIHLGLALNIHPFLLQSYFRFVSSYYLHKIRKEAENDSELLLYEEIFSSILVQSNFVDANCLVYLWPFEFISFELCIISGSFDNPIVSIFKSNEKDKSLRRDNQKKFIYLYCNNSHFYLLDPIRNNGESEEFFFNQLIEEFKVSSLYVQINEVKRIEEKSIFNYFLSIIQNIK